MKLTFLWYFLLALLGTVIYILYGLRKFDKETPLLGVGGTLKKYFSDKIFATSLNIAINLLLTILLALDSTGWFMNFLTYGKFTGELPVQFYAFSAMIGLIGQAILSVWLGKKNPIILTEDKEIQEIAINPNLKIIGKIKTENKP